MNIYKTLRTLLIIITAPITLPLLMMTFSILGVLPFCCISLGMLSAPFVLLSQNEAWMEEWKETLFVGTMFIWAPFRVYWEYIKSGKLDLG